MDAAELPAKDALGAERASAGQLKLDDQGGSFTSTPTSLLKPLKSPLWLDPLRVGAASPGELDTGSTPSNM